MKRDQAFPSNYLGQEDIKQPIVVTISGVRVEQLIDRETGGKKQKPVMSFTDEAIKPLILNNHNWTVLESAYGDDSDLWLGKPIEIYCDPNIMFGKRRTGGLRLRIPSRSGNGTAPFGQPTVEQQINKAIHGMNSAASPENLEKWLTWSNGIPGKSPDDEALLDDAYRVNRQRLTRPINGKPQSPPMAAPELVGAGADRDIPF